MKYLHIYCDGAAQERFKENVRNPVTEGIRPRRKETSTTEKGEAEKGDPVIARDRETKNLPRINTDKRGSETFQTPPGTPGGMTVCIQMKML
jgi:hypothetical protein